MSYKPSLELLKILKRTFLLILLNQTAILYQVALILPKLGELEYSKVLKDANGK